MGLEFLAIKWLRFEKRCVIALRERSPREHQCGKPDVLGVNEKRFLFEIEIKRTMSDFRANNAKPHVHSMNLGNPGTREVWARQFWYLVPAELADKVKPLLPIWAGLLRGPDGKNGDLSSVVRAPVNQDSKRVSGREIYRLGRCMANQLFGFEYANSTKLEQEAWRQKITETDFQI